MRIAILQAAGQPGVIEPNLDTLAAGAAEAADRGAQLLVTPEMFLTGYNVEPQILHALAEPGDGPSARRVTDIARSTGLAVLFGYAERDGERVFNAARLIGADGRFLINHRKSHLYGDLDRRAYSPGDVLGCAELDGVTVGVLICYDVEFPEAVRALALAGAEAVLVPTALMHPHHFVARTLIPARAWENQLFVVYANRCGSEGELRYVGLSTVAGPDGTIVAQADGGASLLMADLDFDARERALRQFSYLDDRRPELYRR